MKENIKDKKPHKQPNKVPGLENSLKELSTSSDTSNKNLNKSKQLDAIFNHLPDATFAINCKGEVIGWNRAIEEMTGVKPTQILGKGNYEYSIPFYGTRRPVLIDLIFKSETEIKNLHYFDIKKNGQALTAETELPKLNGRNLYLWAKASPLYDENRKLIGAIESVRDVTELKKAEDALITSKKQFQNIFDHAPIGIFHTTPEGKAYEVNKALTDMLQYESIEEFTSQVNKSSLQETQYIKEEDRSQWVNEVLQDDEWHSYEVPIHQKTGGIITVELTARSVRNSGGVVQYLEGFLEDITERKVALEKLHRSEERFRAVAESAVDGILTTDEYGKIILFNNSLLNIFGYQKEEILNQPVTLLIPDRLKENFQKRLDKFQATGKHSLSGKTFLSTGLRKDGTEFPFEMSLSTWESERGKFSTSIIRDVTERKEVEEALRESEAKFRSLVETAPEMIWEIDKKGIFTYISPQCLDIMGYHPNEIIGKPIFSLAKNAYFPAPNEIFNTPINEKRRFEVQAEHKNGNELIIEIRSVITTDSNGQLTGFRGIAQDITENKKADEKIKRANIYNRNLLETSLDPLVTIGPDGKINDVNYATEKITGISRKKLLGTDFSNYFTNPGEARASYQKVFQEGLVKNYPLEIQHKNGHITPILYNASVYRDESGKVIGVFAAARDVTGIKEAEKSLQESQNKLKIAMDLAKLVHWEYDVKTDLFIFDDQFYSLYGTTIDQVGGVMMSSKEYARRFLPPEFKDVVADETKKAMETDDPDFKGYVEHPIITANGEKRYLVVRFGIIKNENGQTIKTYGANQDITERIEAEEKLKESENKYHSLYSSMNEGLAIHKLLYNSQGKPVDYIITDVNPAYEKILGLERNQVIGKKATEVYGGLEAPYLELYASVAESGKPAQFETYYKPMDKYFRISVTSPDKGKFATVFEDISLRKNAEDEIKASLKQKELLLQEIHHRVKNNLQIISSLLNLQESYVEDDEAVGVLKESQNRVLSMAMIHEMLYDSEDLSTINFHGYIQNLIYDLFNSYGISSSILRLHLNVDEIHLNIETAVPCGLIISELVSNSLKYAFPQGKQGNLSIDFHRNNTDQLELVIADDGIGLPDNIDFEKIDSLGLRLVNSLVDQLDGILELDRSHGSKFIIRFKELIYRKRI